MMATYSPAFDFDIHAGDCVDGLVPHDVSFPEIKRPDNNVVALQPFGTRLRFGRF